MMMQHDGEEAGPPGFGHIQGQWNMWRNAEQARRIGETDAIALRSYVQWWTHLLSLAQGWGLIWPGTRRRCTRAKRSAAASIRQLREPAEDA